MHRRPKCSCSWMLLAACGLAVVSVAQARAALALPVYRAEASVDAAAEHNAASDAASTAATGDGPPHYKLITEEELLTDASGAAEAKAGGIPREEDAALVALRRNISDIDAARMEPDQGRMPTSPLFRDVDITVDRSSRPSAVVYSGQRSALLAAFNVAHDALHDRDANETAQMQPDERVRLAVSPREALLLESFHNGKLLADLQTLYNVTITALPRMLIIDGNANATLRARIDADQAIAVSRVSAKLARPISAWLNADEGFGLISRTIDVSPAAADLLTTPSGQQVLRNAEDVLTSFGVCLGFRPRLPSGWFQPFMRAVASAPDAETEDPATITLFGGIWVEWAEFNIRSWLAHNSRGEIGESQMFDGMMMEPGASKPPPPPAFYYGGTPAAWGAWCAAALREATAPVSPTYAPWGHWLHPASFDDWLMLAVRLLQLLAVPALAWAACIAFWGTRAALGRTPDCEHT